MDRGQIFVGKKIEVESYEELDKELRPYGFRWDEKEYNVIRIDGKPSEYRLHWNDELELFEANAVFGIEALVSYVDFIEYTGKKETDVEPTLLPDGYERDWIQKISIDKLANELVRVREDISDAEIYLMDLHY